MPKVISRSTISASDDADPSASSLSSLRVSYCLCGEFVLVCDRHLSAVPRRRTDGAHVLRVLDSPVDPKDGKVRKARTFKINAVQRGACLIKRPNGSLEKQYRFHCTRCDLPVGYETTPPPLKSGRFTYILPGALSEVQGQTPPNALLGSDRPQGDGAGEVGDEPDGSAAYKAGSS